jgi:uncharacterized protein (DUF1330 family)
MIMADKAYILFALTVTDADRHQNYLDGALASFDGTTARVVFATDQLTTLEGSAPRKRLILLEFADAASAQSWYDSAAYQMVRPLRLTSADTAFALLINAEQQG